MINPRTCGEASNCTTLRAIKQNTYKFMVDDKNMYLQTAQMKVDSVIVCN